MGQNVSIQAWKMKSWRREKQLKDGEQVYRYYKLPMVPHGFAIWDLQIVKCYFWSTKMSNWHDMSMCIGTPSENRSSRASMSSLFLTFIHIHAHQVPYRIVWSLKLDAQLTTRFHCDYVRPMVREGMTSSRASPCDTWRNDSLVYQIWCVWTLFAQIMRCKEFGVRILAENGLLWDMLVSEIKDFQPFNFRKHV